MLFKIQAALIILLGLIIYGQSFHFGFVFDDHIFVVTNTYIRHFGDIHLMTRWLPMTRLAGIYSFALNYYFDGLNPIGYHIFNFMLHLACVGMVWALARLLVEEFSAGLVFSKGLPYIIAVIFLVHPCQTQAVSYISQRFESMAALFYLGTVYCYLRARLSTGKAQRMILFGSAGLLSVLGIMTKETVITVPVMILASEWILFPGKDFRRFYTVLVCAGVLLAAMFVHLLRADFGVFTKTIFSESHDGDVLTPVRYLLTQMRVFLTFLRLMVLPIHQSVDYDYPVSTALLHPPLTLLGLGVISGIILLIVKLRRRFPVIAFGLAWVLITFSINLVHRANVIFEHKLYLISFGFILSFTAALSFLVKQRGVFLGIVCALVAVLSLLSFQRNKVWQSDLTLWSDAAQKFPYKARTHNNLGQAYSQQGDSLKALSEYNKALAINPQYMEALLNVGIYHQTRGNFTEAERYFTRAIGIGQGPNFARAYFYRGLNDSKQGQGARAVWDYSKSIDVNPDDADAYVNRGLVYVEEGHRQEAYLDFMKALELNPDSQAAMNNLGIIYSFQGRYPGAIAVFNRVLAINPANAESYWNLAVTYYQMKQYAKARTNVLNAQKLGYHVNLNFIYELKKQCILPVYGSQS